MGKFLSFQETAAALIAQNGSPVSVKRALSSGFDPVTQEETSLIETTVYQCVAMPPSRQATYTVGTLEGRNAIELYFALAGKSDTPRIGDVAVIEGADHKIFYTQTYNPAGDGPIFTLAYAERGS